MFNSLSDADKLQMPVTLFEDDINEDGEGNIIIENEIAVGVEKVFNALDRFLDNVDTGTKQAVKELFGVTKPEEAQVAVKALFAVFEDSNDIAKLFGYTSIEDIIENGSREDIMNKYREMVNELASQDVVNMGYVSLLTIARDMMMVLCGTEDAELIKAVQDRDADSIVNKLLISKAVNMNYIIKKTVERKVNDDFVIDLTKIKSAVENPELSKENPAELLRKLADAFDGGIKNSRADIKNALMDLSNIHAVAAAA